ncbi:unnamed protein product [Lymnaea stagnalis]|uniref:SKA complex subunit 1 n=1 Tax=Lymnaea stagnalis TaxID=6523 RepID=A0AAV2HC06_LYMST
MLITIMDSGTLEDLTQHFQKTLSVLKNALMLSSAIGDIDYNENAYNLNKLLDAMKFELRNMRKNVETAKVQLESYKNIKLQTETFIESLQYGLDNVPSRLPKMKPQDEGKVKQGIADCLPKAEPVGKVNNNNNGCNYLNYITVGEFESVPKYMKGRLTYDGINCAIEQLDKAFTEKYKIMKQKKPQLSSANRKLYEAFRLQESNDTKGVHFIVEKDIAEFTNLKLDSSTRNILTILRHCGMMHEIRGAGLVRFATYY